MTDLPSVAGEPALAAPVRRLLRCAALLGLHAHRVEAATDGERHGLEEIRAAAEALLASAGEVARGAAVAAEEAQASNAAASEGAGLIAAMLGELETASQTAGETEATLAALTARVAGVLEVAETLDAIASRIKLVALNATIEAARAGEHGAGFRVVAEEVGRLATQSTQAVATVHGILGDAREQIAAGARAGAAIGQATAGAIERGQASGACFDDIARRIEALDGVASEVAVAADQQAQALSQLDGSLDAVVIGAGAAYDSAAALTVSLGDLEGAGGEVSADALVLEYGPGARAASEALRMIHTALMPLVDVPRRHAGHLLAHARMRLAVTGRLESADLAGLDELLRASLTARRGVLANAALSIVPGRLADRDYWIQVWAMGPDGVFALDTPLDPGAADFYNYPEQDWFRVPITTDAPWTSEPYFDEGGSDLHVITIATPVTDDDGPLAVSSADLDLTQVGAICAPALASLRPAVLISATGTVIATNTPERFTPGTEAGLTDPERWTSTPSIALGWSLLTEG